jgi:hypothetical protein
MENFCVFTGILLPIASNPVVVFRRCSSTICINIYSQAGIESGNLYSGKRNRQSGTANDFIHIQAENDIIVAPTRDFIPPHRPGVKILAVGIICRLKRSPK